MTRITTHGAGLGVKKELRIRPADGASRPYAIHVNPGLDRPGGEA